jgi:hypothetical protein
VLGIAYIGGISRPAGAIVAGLISAAGPFNYVVDEYIGLGKWVDLVSGLGLVFMAVAHPEGLAADFARLGIWMNRKFARVRHRPTATVAPHESGEHPPDGPSEPGGGVHRDVPHASPPAAQQEISNVIGGAP